MPSFNYGNLVKSNVNFLAGYFGKNPNAMNNAIGGYMGILGDLFGSGSSSTSAQRLNREDTDWMYQKQSDYWRANTEWYNDNGYSMLRSGLEKAGYNPLMALGAQPLNGATVAGSAVDVDSSARSFNLPQSLNTARAMLANTNADTLLKRAQIDETNSRSALEVSQKLLNDEDIPYRAKKNVAEIINIKTDSKKKEAEIENIKANTGVAISQTTLNNVEAQYKRILANYTITQQRYVSTITEKISQGIDLNKPEQDFVRNHPELAQFYVGMRQFGNAFGSLLHSININSYENISLNK